MLKLASNGSAHKTSVVAAISYSSFDTGRIVYLLLGEVYVKHGFASFFVICFAKKMQVMPGLTHRNEVAEADADPVI